jgi:hypothetical protein
MRLDGNYEIIAFYYYFDLYDKSYVYYHLTCHIKHLLLNKRPHYSCTS